MDKKYVVDRIINDIAILENINNKEKIEVNIKDLPNDIHDGIILTYKHDKYYINETEYNNRKDYIENLFNKLKN